MINCSYCQKRLGLNHFSNFCDRKCWSDSFNQTRLTKTIDTYLNKVFENRYGEKFRITKITTYDCVEIEFVDTGYVLKNQAISNLLRRGVNQPTSPTVVGIGYLGTGKDFVRDSNGNTTLEYQKWIDLLKRAKKNHTHITDGVSENFRDFGYFFNWCNRQVYFGEIGCQLDKDCLDFDLRKIYSENTCVFIPQELNAFFKSNSHKLKTTSHNLPVGVRFNKRNNCFIAGSGNKYLGSFSNIEEARSAYLQGKITQAINLAEKWSGKLDERVIHVLMNYSDHYHRFER